jgi:hypothetical protein
VTPLRLLCNTGQTICDKFLRLFVRKQFFQKTRNSCTFSEKVFGIKEREFDRSLEFTGRCMTWRRFMGIGPHSPLNAMGYFDSSITPAFVRFCSTIHSPFPQRRQCNTE